MSWLTANLPGIGGVYKQVPQDFQVEEIPLYPCSGTGEHLYLWMEKSGISTRDMLQQLTRGLRIKEQEIGYAGLKDTRALTRQRVSIPFKKYDQVNNLNLKNCKIVNIERHTNKLRLGHLAGNRFTIKLQNVHPEAAARTEAIFIQLQKKGVPNLFGEQRYGVLGNSSQLGQFLVQRKYEDFCRSLIGEPDLIRNPNWKNAATAYQRGDIQGALEYLPGGMRDERRLLNSLSAKQSYQQAVLELPRNLLRLFLSAAQSSFFDLLLVQRISQLDQLMTGDIAMKHVNGACFRVERAAEEQDRADHFEISPTAPLFGTKVMLATDQPGRAETTLLSTAGLSLESWHLGQGLTMPGERRALRVPLTDAKIIAADKETLTLSFALPKGSYATSVLREIIK